MTRMRKPITHLCLALACALLGSALAQEPLTRLAPPDAALVVSLQTGGEVAADLRADVGALDWQGAGETLERLLAALDPSLLTGDLAELTEFTEIGDALREFCPALADSFDSIAGQDRFPRFEAMLTVQPRLINVPVTGLVRIDDLGAREQRSLESALGECASRTQEFAEVGIPGSGTVYDFPSGFRTVHVALTESGLLAIGSDLPTAMIPLLGRAASGAAGSGTDPFSAFDATEGYSLGVALRTEPVLAAFGSLLFQAGGTDDALARRVRDAIDTVDSIAWRATLDGDGFFNELALAIDPDRPDSELARLLLCDGCNLARPYLAPADAVSFASSPLPLDRLIDYIDGFLAAAGEEGTLTELLQREAGVTLSPELLDALGSGAYTYSLATIGTDLSTLLYRPGQVTVVPVSAAAPVREGVAALLESVQSLVAESAAGATVPLAIREAEYRGVDYWRVQASANLDLGIGLVGDNLVLALPSRSIESAVDTFNGAPSLVGSARYRNLLAATPNGALGLSWHDTQGTLNGIADLLRLASQPLAFAASIALMEGEEDSDDFSMAIPEAAGGEQVQLPDEIQVLDPGTTEGELSDQGEELDEYVAGDLSDVYRVEGVLPGDEVTVVLESQAFDTMLQLLDGNGMVLDSNDDSPDTTRSELTFAVEPGQEYVIQATSYWGDATGAYTLTVERAEGTAGATAGPLEPQPLAPGTTNGQLAEADGQRFDKLSDIYRLEGVAAGQQVTLVLESEQFDTMLYLRDAGGQVLRSNDDAPDTTRSEIAFVTEEGMEYQVQVTSYWGDDTGDYTLSVTSAAPPVAVEPPGFEELLSLFELPAQIFEALARNTGPTTGYSTSSDGLLYSRGFTELR